MILISLGIFAGIKHGFRPGGWLIMLLIGGIFLADRFYDGSVDLVPFLLVGVLMLVGLMILLRPWRHRKHPHHGGSASFRERRRRYRRFRPATAVKDKGQ